MATLSGGKALEQKLKELSKNLSKAALLRVGFLEGATYPETGTPVAQVAWIQENGAPAGRIPARPFFRPMIEKNKDKWGDILGNLLVAHDYDVEKCLGLMGEGMRAQLQQSIHDVNSPPLSDITLMLRKMKSQNQGLVVTGKTVGEAARRVAEGGPIGSVNSKPLDETGHMISSADYEVVS